MHEILFRGKRADNGEWYKFTSESPYFPEIIGNIHDNPELLKGE